MYQLSTSKSLVQNRHDQQMLVARFSQLQKALQYVKSLKFLDLRGRWYLTSFNDELNKIQSRAQSAWTLKFGHKEKSSNAWYSYI